jgi:hypothetical protein
MYFGHATMIARKLCLHGLTHCLHRLLQAMRLCSVRKKLHSSFRFWLMRGIRNTSFHVFGME